MLYLALDVGTTNTRVWLLKDTRVLTRIERSVGVRNSAILGNSSMLSKTLRDAIDSLKKTFGKPTCVLAAGMITSGRGLCEVPHVEAPAGKKKLSQHVRMKRFAEICPYPFFLVPGVRIKRAPGVLKNIHEVDIIRGEESEIVGLCMRQDLSSSWLFLHLGSHTKAIVVNRKGEIIRSLSTLSGECSDVIQQATILSDNLKISQKTQLTKKFFDAGYQQSDKYGLLRALFMVRLLGENGRYTHSNLYSFFLGALLASDFQALQNAGLLKGATTPIILSGHAQLQKAWCLLLQRHGRPFTIIKKREREHAFLDGLRTIVFSSDAFAKFSH